MAAGRERRRDRILRVVPGHPVWTLLLLAVVTLLSLSTMVDRETGKSRLLVDSSVDSMLPEDDEGRRYFQKVKDAFQIGESILVVLVGDDIFTGANLARIQRTTERIEELDHVESVSSLSTSLNIRSEAGSLLIEPFFEEVPTDPAALADLRRRALGDPIYAGNLVSRDGRASVLVVKLLDLPEQELIDAKVDEKISGIAEEESGDLEVWVAGGAHVKAEISRLALADLVFVIPLAILVIAAIALVTTRSLRGVLIPVLTVTISLIWSLALVALAWGKLNMVTVAAPPVLIVVGFAYAIHVVSAYEDVLRGEHGAGCSREEAIFLALRKITVPVVFTGITTAAAFLSLTTSSIGAIQQFGLYCGIGVFLTMFVALTLGPAMLRLMRLPTKLREPGAGQRFDHFLERLALFDLRHRPVILGAGAVVALISLVGMSEIRVRTDTVSNFKEGNIARRHFELVNEHLEGANGFYVVLETSYPDAFKEPINLRVVEELQGWIEAQPEVGGTTSLVDYVKVINRGFHEDQEDAFAIPDSRELVAQLLFIGGNDELDTFVETSYQLANIVVRTSAMDSSDVMELVTRIEERLLELPQHLQARVTGNSVLVSKTMDDIALGQALSLGTAFVIIYVILAILFTSFWAGFIALIPNALPVLVYFGVLGWTGVTLNVTTGLVACLVLGIAVDDTIHLMAHFNSAAKRHADERKGIIEALLHVGRPVTYTTAALCVGFLTLTMSTMRNQVEFGLLASFTLAVAWVIDVTFTPALAARMRIVSLWDILTLDLGEDPQNSIPLFAGLTHAHARIVAVMTSMRSFPAGHQLIHLGEKGDEMFVVIDGELSASIPADGGSVLLRSLGRGDVIGEVGLFYGERTADVHAITDVRLLRLTQNNLERLQRRYPRIGARIYANLSSVLADRLASITPRVR